MKAPQHPEGLGCALHQQLEAVETRRRRRSPRAARRRKPRRWRPCRLRGSCCWLGDAGLARGRGGGELDGGGGGGSGRLVGELSCSLVVPLALLA
eukprot:scaffold75983_cov33-Phaeocystis_antarctica.AAC.1